MEIQKMVNPVFGIASILQLFATPGEVNERLSSVLDSLVGLGTQRLASVVSRVEALVNPLVFGLGS